MLWLVDKLDIILSFFSISDRMADSIKEEPDLKEIDIKDEIASLQHETFLSAPVEETCTIYVKEEYVKIELAEIKGKH